MPGTIGERSDADLGRLWPGMTEGNRNHTAFAISRNLNFWIFPVLVFGNSAKTT